jgi:hypothetical protein
MASRNFVAGRADKPGYRSRISLSDADYFNMSENERRIAKTDDGAIEYALSTIPTSTPVQCRTER